MTDEQLEALLERLERALQSDVQEELDKVAGEFSRSLEGATELVAAAFSVSRIGDMWRRRVPRVMDALRRITGRASRVTADEVNVAPPPARELDDALKPWSEATTRLLNQIGDRLSEVAVEQLSEGVAAGETTEQLKRRLRQVFSRTGTQLGPVRSERIAQTEATRAFNAGTQAAGEALQGPGLAVVKQWLTRGDAKVREPHREVNGQVQQLDDTFDVGGFPMQYPGDPSAPADLTIGCRCILKTAVAQERTAATVTGLESAAELVSNMPRQLKRYWLTGPGAAKIRWGTPGSFERCVRELRNDFPQNPEGLCANLYHETTGHWPGQNKDGAAVTEFTGAMVALVPSAEHAERLARYSDLGADELHVTLMYLGEAADYSEDARIRVISAMSAVSDWLSPTDARVFGVALWNPDGESPCWVWNVGDHHGDGAPPQGLMDVHREVVYALEGRHGECPNMPAQYTPWAPHMAISYSPDLSMDGIGDSCGPVVFDRLRVAFAGEYTDFPLAGVDTIREDEPYPEDHHDGLMMWSTPDPAALAFENQQTGDGRVFAPGAIYWEGDGPWPLMANENFDSHDDAALAGAITALYRDGDRIGGEGCLYLGQESGREAAELLMQGAPLGVSVDLDDVDLEMVAMNEDPNAPEDVEPYRARLLQASLLPTESGYILRGIGDHRMSACSGTMVFEAPQMTFFVGPDGRVPRDAFELEAAAGDTGQGGAVVDVQRSGDYLLRITRARLRGATLVTIPAYAGARIVPDGVDMVMPVDVEMSAAAAISNYDRVVRVLRRAKQPVTAALVARYLRISIAAARRYLAQAVQKGDAVRLTRGTYARPAEADAPAVTASGASLPTSLTASVSGAIDLPVAPRDHAWDGPGAEARVFEWADGDCDKIQRAFAYRDESAPCEEHRAYKLGYADVVDGKLTIIPRGVFAAEAALNGARGGVDIPADEKGAVQRKLAAVRAHVDEETGGEQMDDMQASAWTAMADLPPMPAAWFREPTAEELPPGGAGVNYSNGRIFGWVAQANEPHAGYAKRIVINDLGRIDTTHFLRQRFTLDDGSTVKAGAFTMNAGHHRDGAECETAVCQFDDTRTVAGIVTVGMNERGMWFSGAAAPWMSEWDRSVFMATQPSYHLKQGSGGQWQLRAVLSVPVPGHSSPLLASAVVERSQLALTAAAAMAEVEAVVTREQSLMVPQQAAPAIDYDRLADSMVAAMARAEQRKLDEAGELEALIAEARRMDANTTDDGK